MLDELDLSEFWSLENLGICDSPDPRGDAEAIDNFNDNVSFQDGRYSVSLPFNGKRTELDTHYKLTEGRLCSLVKRLNDNPVLFRKYVEIIEDQERKGVVEKVSSGATWSDRVRYIPHHAVVTQ